MHHFLGKQEVNRFRGSADKQTTLISFLPCSSGVPLLLVATSHCQYAMEGFTTATCQNGKKKKKKEKYYQEKY
jgi:hypothetical protein